MTIPFDGTPLLMDVLQERGIPFVHPCGGRGVCGKCAVMATGQISAPNEAELHAGVRLSCQMRLLGDCDVTLPKTEHMEDEAPAILNSMVGLAVDIGTTTLAVRQYDVLTGTLLRETGALNPQTNFSADVIGRISAAADGKAEAMQAQLLDTLRRMIGNTEAVRQAVMTGNTVMLYLLTGRDPAPLSVPPFAADEWFGKTEAVLGMSVYLPRCIGAFAGADLTCAVLASGMTERAESALLCDVGTNGEMALWHRKTLYVASTAVGPAFEGAGISCGCGSVPGAIDKVWTVMNSFDVRTIEAERAIGVCGSGLLDAVAVMLQLRLIDRSGTMDGSEITLADGVKLTQEDIRQVQLAKAAVAAGIETLLHEAGVTEQEIAVLYFAGGFGSHLSPRSAAAIGMIPAAFVPKAKTLGNAALEGAEELLLHPEKREQADELARSAQTVTLSGNPSFAQRYIDHMNF